MPIGKLPAKFAKTSEFKLKSVAPTSVMKPKLRKKLAFRGK